MSYLNPDSGSNLNTGPPRSEILVCHIFLAYLMGSSRYLFYQIF